MPGRAALGVPESRALVDEGKKNRPARLVPEK